MKKILSIMVATFIATTNLWAQFPDPFLADEDRPDGKLWIPAPPSLTGGDFANVVATDAYQAQLKKAREEYQRIRKEQSSGIKERTVTPTTSETPIYDLQGRQLNGTPTEKGIYIQGNNKVYNTNTSK
ncbi:MAG: hypothetical protein J5924_06270 [Bacteroidaceae bacterium]|jgi:hypothetical protein|nr:hypothetical protein [Bacteroidaceae bacterium]